MFNVKNSKKQGDIGLGSAISYFTSIGITVLIPLTDSQDYDLAVEINNDIKKVQIKTTSYKNPSGKYSINLSVKGGNRSYNIIKKFDKTKVDLLFILTDEGNKYLIPSPDFTSNLSLGKKYDVFKI